MDHLLRVAREHWGLVGSLSPLPGERDWNYRLDAEGVDAVAGMAVYTGALPLSRRWEK